MQLGRFLAAAADAIYVFFADDSAGYVQQEDGDEPSELYATPGIEPLAARPSAAAASQAPQPPAAARPAQAAKTQLSRPSTPPPSQPAFVTTVSNIKLAVRNETPQEHAYNRSLYLHAMAERGVWASELELNLLAGVLAVRLQVFIGDANSGGYRLVQEMGEVASKQVVDMVHVNGNHFRALLETDPHARNKGRLSLGEVRGAAHFHEIDVPGAGDCAFLAFAYATDAPHARTLLDLYNEQRRRPTSQALRGLRDNRQLCTYLKLDASNYADDTAFIEAALDRVAILQRRSAVAALRSCEQEARIDAAVVAELMQAQQEG